MEEKAKELNPEELESVSGGQQQKGYTLPMYWEYCPICKQDRRFVLDDNAQYYCCQVCGHKDK